MFTLSWLILDMPSRTHKVQYVCARQRKNTGLSSHCSQAEGASAENGLTAGSTFGVSLSSTAKMVSALKLGPSWPGQSNNFLNNPKEGLSGGASARKLWTRTMWSRAIGSGLARPTPKSDRPAAASSPSGVPERLLSGNQI